MTIIDQLKDMKARIATNDISLSDTDILNAAIHQLQELTTKQTEAIPDITDMGEALCNQESVYINASNCTIKILCNRATDPPPTFAGGEM